MIPPNIMNFLIVYIFAVVTALILGPLAIDLARALGAVDHPLRGAHNINPRQTPLAGGFMLVFPILLVGVGKLALAGELKDYSLYWHILLPSLIIFAMGLLDDIFGFSAIVKFIGQVVAAGMLVLLGEQIHLFPLEWLNWLVTVLWLVGITNAMNMIDSREGITLGTGLIIALTLTFLSFQSQQPQITFMGALWVGACAGTFYFNRLPGLSFLGDSGAQFLGFSLAALAMSQNPLGFQPTNSWFLPILLFAVPIMDVAQVVVTRLMKRQPVFQGDTNHSFHRLERVLGGALKAVLVLLAVSLVLNTLGYILLFVSPAAANITFFVVAALGVAAMGMLVWLDEKRKKKAEMAMEKEGSVGEDGTHR